MGSAGLFHSPSICETHPTCRNPGPWTPKGKWGRGSFSQIHNTEWGKWEVHQGSGSVRYLYHYSYFIDNETEDQRGTYPKIKWPGSSRGKTQGWEVELWRPCWDILLKFCDAHSHWGRFGPSSQWIFPITCFSTFSLLAKQTVPYWAYCVQCTVLNVGEGWDNEACHMNSAPGIF